MKLAISIFQVDESGHRASSEDDDFRIVDFTPEDLLHVADCVSVGNDDPPDDDIVSIPAEVQDAAFRFENDLRNAVARFNETDADANADANDGFEFGG